MQKPPQSLKSPGPYSNNFGRVDTVLNLTRVDIFWVLGDCFPATCFNPLNSEVLMVPRQIL